MRKLLAYIPIVAVISGAALFVMHLVIVGIREMTSEQLLTGGGVMVFAVWLAWGLGEISQEEHGREP